MTRCGHVALAGAPNVGKSSLLNALVGEHLAIVSPKAQATRLPVTGIRTEGDTQFVFHDLPGLLDPAYLLQTRMLERAVDAMRRAHVVLHLHPAADAPAPDLTRLAGLDAPLATPVVVVYTKGDLVDRAGADRLRAAGAEVVSSATADGLDALLARVRGHLPERPFEYDPEDIGTQPLRFFAVEYLREAAFIHLGDELPYAFAAEIEEFREEKRPVYIRATLFVERESQKSIVIGRGGGTIKALGTHARGRLEALLGSPVYLDLWVKALPKWRRSPAALARFGFPETAHDKEHA
jgi:GTP-binding protein Era